MEYWSIMGKRGVGVMEYWSGWVERKMGLMEVSVVHVFAVLLLLAVSASGLIAQRSDESWLRMSPPLRSFSPSQVRLLDGPFLEARKRTEQYLLQLDPDRLLHTFRLNAGLTSNATALGGWESPNVELRGHSLGHYLTACALMYANTGDERFKQRGKYVVIELGKVQQALEKRGSNEGYLSAFPEEFIDRVEQRKWVWAPYYTLHKIMAGLLDMYLHCGTDPALRVLTEMAGWVHRRMTNLTHEQRQAMLQTEFGGMNDVLTRLYLATGVEKHLGLARMFDHDRIFGPLSRGVDSLDGLHGNTQIPKAIGAVKEYEATGKKRYLDIARFFWKRVAETRSYVIGGNTNDEHFFPVDQMKYNLGSASTETCNSYNMLKLTRDLFAHDVSASYMDFYERVLYNHILASQDPQTGMMCYYVPMKPGAFKTFSTPDSSFWCCVGTGMENPARYVEAIYSRGEDDLYVNLFIPSEVTWKEKGIALRQETQMPNAGHTRMIISASKPVRCSIWIRVPAWARPGATITINGSAIQTEASPSSYVTLNRMWNDRDVIDATFPMSVVPEPMPNEPRIVALLYGPLVLAGDLGPHGLTAAHEYGPEAPQMRTIEPVDVPSFVLAEDDAPERHVQKIDGPDLAFQTVGIGHPSDVRLMPFASTFHTRYTVYWRLKTPEEKSASDEEERRRISWREGVNRRTVDVVDIHSRESERSHQFKGEHFGDHWYDNRRGREGRGGWIAYAMAVDSSSPVGLVCTYRGSEGKRSEFDLLVDSVRVAEESLTTLPPEFIEKEYRIPPSLTAGKNTIVVAFRSREGAIAGPVFELRTVRNATGRK